LTSLKRKLKIEKNFQKMKIVEESCVKKEEQYTLEILTRIEENGRVTQPEIAKHLGISLGLTNAFIKRIARKGYIKLTTIPRDRVKYLVTPKGFAEKTNLTVKYLQYSLKFYKRAKDTLSRAYVQMQRDGAKKIVFCGIGEIAEIAYILLQQNHMSLSGVVDEKKAGKKFMKRRVGSLADLKNYDFDKILITSFQAPENIVNKIRSMGVGEEQLVALGEVAVIRKEAKQQRQARR